MAEHVAQLRIEPISSRWQRAAFDCGQPNLNEYLQKYARQNDERNIAKAFVAVDSGNEVKGYYCISTAEVHFAKLHDDITKTLPRYPVPAALIGRLAIDQSIEGRGLGQRLLIDALARIATTSEQIGIKVVIVEAINQKAKSLCKHNGFVGFRGKPMKLFLPIETIRRLFN